MWRAFPNPEYQYKQICMLTHITKDQLKNAAIECRLCCLSLWLIKTLIPKYKIPCLQKAQIVQNVPEVMSDCCE